MNSEVGSIMSFFHSIFPVKVYKLNAPVNFKVPSMYFPPPRPTTHNDTNQTFLKSYTLSVKLFHEDSQKAYAAGESIIDEISSNRNILPLLETDGTPTGDYMRISDFELRIADQGVAIIIVNWDSRYYYNRKPATPLEDVTFDSKLKE